MGKSRKKKRRERDLEERPSRFSAGSSSRTFPSSEIESAPKGLETGIKEPEASDGKRRVRYIEREEREGGGGWSRFWSNEKGTRKRKRGARVFMKTSQSSDRRRDDVCDDYFDRGRVGEISTPAPRTSRELNARSPLGLPSE